MDESEAGDVRLATSTRRERAPSAGVAERSRSPQKLQRQRFSTFHRLLSDRDHFVILSLGGGSLPALCGNLALVRIIEDLGLAEQIDEVWGTSAGAIVGGGWASGATVEEILALTRSLEPRGGMDIVWGRLLRSALLYPFGRSLPDGLVRGRRIAKRIRAGLRANTFDDCRVVFRCIACSDDGRARRKVFREGPLLSAILASMSLPGVFEPRDPFTGRRRGHCDGGLVEKTPLLSPIADYKLREDSRKLVIVATHFHRQPGHGPARGFVHRFVHTINVLEDQLWEHQLAESRRFDDVTVLMLNPHYDDLGQFDFAVVDSTYTFAHDEFVKQLANSNVMKLLAQK